jgi:hypothetical protein
MVPAFHVGKPPTSGINGQDNQGPDQINAYQTQSEARRVIVSARHKVQDFASAMASQQAGGGGGSTNDQEMEQVVEKWDAAEHEQGLTGPRKGFSLEPH